MYFHHFLQPELIRFQVNQASPYDFWLTLGTFSAVVVALLGERFWRFIDKPKIKVEFNKDSERCLRWAIATPIIQNEGLKENIKKYYFRLKITNTGGTAKKLRVRVDVRDSYGNELERFEPSTLRWINGREETDLLRGESEYVNLLSQVVENHEIKNRLTVEVSDTAPRGIAWDRPIDKYGYSVVVYGENIEPVSLYAKFIPNTNKNKPGELKIIN